MKKIFFSWLFSLSLIAVAAQSPAEASVNNIVFLLPAFVNGKVLFSNGSQQEVLLNYNTLFSQMIFEKDSLKLAIDQSDNVDTVYIGSRKFVPVDTFFFEVRLEQTKFPLYINHTCTVSKSGAATPFGGNSQTGAVQNLSSYRLGVSTPYQLKVADSYTVNHLSDFYIKTAAGFIQLKKSKQVKALFPFKEKQVSDFIKKQHTNFSNQKDVEQLLIYISQLQ